jgi:hypothetical protein
MILRPMGMLRGASAAALQTGFIAPTSALSFSRLIGGGGSPVLAWTDPENIYGAGEASITVSTFDNGVIPRVLACLAFDLSALADTAEIVGIEVRVACRCSAGSANWIGMAILTGVTTSTVGTVAHYTDSDVPQAFPATEETLTFGGPTDLWGAESLTAATLKASTAGLGFQAQATANDTDIYVSSVTANFYYTT